MRADDSDVNIKCEQELLESGWRFKLRKKGRHAKHCLIAVDGVADTLYDFILFYWTSAFSRTLPLEQGLRAPQSCFQRVPCSASY